MFRFSGLSGVISGVFFVCVSIVMCVYHLIIFLKCIM